MKRITVKIIIGIALLLPFLQSCSKEPMYNNLVDGSAISQPYKPHTVIEELSNGAHIVTPEVLTDGVVLGNKLENPYSLKVMQAAYRKLHPNTKSPHDTLTPNYAYIRFLPTDVDDINYLCDSELELFNYPLDYEIIGDPSDYHDSSIADNQITWLYTVIPINDPIPPVDHEILDLDYIPDERNKDLEDEAIGSVGLGNNLNQQSTGCIRVYTGNGSPSNPYVGVKGVKVRARSFLKIRTGYTDSDGNYTIQGYNDFHYEPRFEIRWENRNGFTEGHGLALALPQSTYMGSSRSMTISRSQNNTWELATVNNAADKWFNYCELNSLTKPANDLRIWTWNLSGAATPMLHHGTLNYMQISDIITLLTRFDKTGLSTVVYEIIESLVTLLGPDIVINCNDNDTYDYIGSKTIHEMAHASHFQRIGSSVSQRASWWADVVDYEAGRILSTIATTQDPYGAESNAGSGPCGVAEMWAYAIEKMQYPNTPISSFWFKPAALNVLNTSYGLSFNNYEECLTPNVRSVSAFIDELVRLHPELEESIRNVFSRI